MKSLVAIALLLSLPDLGNRSGVLAQTPRSGTVATNPLCNNLRLTHTVPSYLTTVTAVSPDNKILVTGSLEGVLRVWDLSTNTLVRTLPSGHLSAVGAVAISPDGQTLVSLGYRFYRNAELKSWRLQDGHLLYTTPLNLEVKRLEQFSFSPDGQTFQISGLSSQKNQRITHNIEVPTGRLRKTLPTQGPEPETITTVSPDGRLQMQFEGDLVKLQNARTGQEICRFPRRANLGGVSLGQFTADSRSIVVTHANQIQIWQLTDRCTPTTSGDRTLNQRGMQALQQQQPAIAFRLFWQALDRQLQTCNRAGMGETLYFLGRAADAMSYFGKLQALKFYQLALPIAQEMGDRPRQADILARLGDQPYLGRIEEAFPSSVAAYQQALAIRQELTDLPGQQAILIKLGLLYASYARSLDTKTTQSYFQQGIVSGEAQSYFDQAVALGRTLEGATGEREALLNIVIQHHQLGGKYEDWVQRMLERAEALSQAAGDRSRLIRAVILRGDNYRYASSQQEQELAPKQYERALKLQQEVSDHQGRIQTLLKMARALYRSYTRDAKENAKALAVLEQALNLSRTHQNAQVMAEVLETIAQVHRQHHLKQALPYLQQALPLRQQAKNAQNLAQTYQDLGETYYGLQQYQPAIAAFQQALQLRQALGDPFNRQRLLYWLGRSYDALGQSPLALNFYQQSVALIREEEDVFEEDGYKDNEMGAILNRMGELSVKLNHSKQASEFFQQAIGLCPPWQALMLNMGQLYEQLGQPDMALLAFDSAITFKRGLCQKGAGGREDATLLDTARVSAAEIAYASSTESIYRRGTAIGANLLKRGDVYLKMNRRQEALKSYQEALKVFQEAGDKASAAAVQKKIRSLQ